MIRGRKGFTLMETMVSIAVLVTVSAVVVPSLNDGLSALRIAEAASTLESWEEAVKAFSGDAVEVKNNASVKRFPSTLTQLTRRVTDNSDVDTDICGNRFPNGLASKWSGPYVQAVIPEAGLPVSIGVLQDRFGYDGTLNKEQIILYIKNVGYKDAVALNDVLDGDLDLRGAAPYLTNTTGRVRWQVTSSGAPITDKGQLFTLEFRTAGPKC